MNPRALLLGGAGRLPFNGHLRLRVEGEGAVLSVAGRVAAGQAPPEAWQAVLALHGALAGVRGRSALELLAAADVALSALDPAGLGAARGEDLSLLLVAAGADGRFFTGRNLDALWTPELRPVPLPSDAVPQPAPAETLVGRCQGDKETPDAARIFAQCGVRS